MNFAKLFHKSNSSIHQLQGNVLDCTIEQIRGNKVIVDTGMRASFVCFRDELCEPSAVAGIAGYRLLAIDRRWYGGNQNNRLAAKGSPDHPAAQVRSTKRDEGAQHGLGQVLRSGMEIIEPLRGPALSWATCHSIPRGESFRRSVLTQIACGDPLYKARFQKHSAGRRNIADASRLPLVGPLYVPSPSPVIRLRGSSLFAGSHGRNFSFRRTINGAFVPFLTAKQKLPHRIQISSTEARLREIMSSPKFGFWASLRAALLQRRIPSVIHSGSADCAREFFKSGKITRSVRILGAPQPAEARQRKLKGPLGRGMQATLRDLTIARPASGPSILASRRGGAASGILAQRPPGFREPPSPYGATGCKQLPRLKASEPNGTCGVHRPCVIGVEEKRSTLSGELTPIGPKSMEKISKRKLVWTELTKLWRTSAKNRMKARLRVDGSLPGFILNSVNGGYAVAIAGYIAFLPKSLCLNKKVFIGQWRQFAIIGMNPKIANIVVKEI